MLLAAFQFVVMAIVTLFIVVFLGNDDPRTTFFVFAALAGLLSLEPICRTFFEAAGGAKPVSRPSGGRILWAAFGLFFASFALSLIWVQDDGASFRVAGWIVVATALIGPASAALATYFGWKRR